MPKNEGLPVSIIVPAYNEEKLLPFFINKVTNYLKKEQVNYELILVENGSSDRTLEIAANIAKVNKRIQVVHLAVPGYGLAIIEGLRKARGKYVIIFNVDYWDKRFIDLTRVDMLGYDLVSGSKNLPGSFDRRPWGRRFVTRSFNLFLRLACGFKGTDTHGVKLLRSRKVMPVVKKCKMRTGIFDSELVVRAQRAGLKILELPIDIKEIRPNRFGLKRFLQAPTDIAQLFFALRE